MTVEISDQTASTIATYLSRYANRDDLPYGPDEREASNLASELWESIDD